MKHHRWTYAYYQYLRGDPDKGRWLCASCGTVWNGDLKPRGSRMYRKIGVFADCEAQLVAGVMES